VNFEHGLRMQDNMSVEKMAKENGGCGGGCSGG